MQFNLINIHGAPLSKNPKWSRNWCRKKGRAQEGCSKINKDMISTPKEAKTIAGIDELLSKVQGRMTRIIKEGKTQCLSNNFQ